nr:hypothetical protein [Candidatus Rhodobacter lobularis]
MIRVDRKLNSTDVLDALTDLCILCGPLEYIRSDNGPLAIVARINGATRLALLPKKVRD